MNLYNISKNQISKKVGFLEQFKVLKNFYLPTYLIPIPNQAGGLKKAMN
jgi:hypothetical protein